MKLFDNVRLNSGAKILIFSPHAKKYSEFINSVISNSTIEIIPNNMLEEFDSIEKYDLIFLENIGPISLDWSRFCMSFARIYIVISKNTYREINFKNINFIDSYSVGLNIILQEYWHLALSEKIFPFLVIHPKFTWIKDKVMEAISNSLPNVSVRSIEIVYSKQLVKEFYNNTPTYNLLDEFLEKQKVYGLKAILLTFKSDNLNVCEIIHKLAKFKRQHRNKFGRIEAEVHDVNGNKAMMLPFHVPEPNESIILKQSINRLCVK